jgi:cellobiose PTS system EIIA component
MNEINVKEEMLQTAMKIIISAGDARNLIKEALDAIAAQQFDLAGKKMDQAKNFIRIAHESQTEMIQSEARGEKMEYSILFSHAQDTLMTISSEYNIASQMMKIFLSLSERINRIEMRE